MSSYRRRTPFLNLFQYIDWTEYLIDWARKERMQNRRTRYDTYTFLWYMSGLIHTT